MAENPQPSQDPVAATATSSTSVPESGPKAQQQQSGNSKRKRNGDQPRRNRDWEPRNKWRKSRPREDRSQDNKGGSAEVEHLSTEEDKKYRNPVSRTDRREKRKAAGIVPVYSTQFTEEELANESRRKKTKVALMIGYSGTGYKGLQMSDTEKTIEGDLFKGLVAAGAISKANADDPKKSSFVRCARTDKGVHASGNLVSLKLIVEDEDIVERINKELSPQIRVWGYEPVRAAFSAYTFCDSRIYEYLIPTHSFLPPHPATFLAKQVAHYNSRVEGAAEAATARLDGTEKFWQEAQEQYVQPVIDSLDPEIAKVALSRLYESFDSFQIPDEKTRIAEGRSLSDDEDNGDMSEDEQDQPAPEKIETQESEPVVATEKTQIEESQPAVTAEEFQESQPAVENSKSVPSGPAPDDVRARRVEIDHAVKKLKQAHLAAKKAYRISDARLGRVRRLLSQFVGTHKYHNYTPEKKFNDPSSKRHIRSFLAGQPFTIGDTEWLSMKVHGQSFMMHQIRKMVSMMVLVARCGTDEARIEDSFSDVKISIPKAPSLGLLLERPVFDNYNDLVRFQRIPQTETPKPRIEFSKYEKEILEFKQREIYERIYREENAENTFHTMWTSLDAFRNARLTYLTARGINPVDDEAPPEKQDPAWEKEDDDEKPDDLGD